MAAGRSAVDGVLSMNPVHQVDSRVMEEWRLGVKATTPNSQILKITFNMGGVELQKSSVMP